MTRLPERSRPSLELGRWLEAQSRRERRAVRLEDALLADRYATYFAFRLRFFGLRTVVTAILHAFKILLVARAFSQNDLLVILAVGAGTAIGNDFWWGALERMRQTIRALRRNALIHRVPAEIGRWVRLAVGLSVAGIAAATAVLAISVVLGRGPQPVGVYAAILLAGGALRLTAKAYHSGAFALRRIYRPIGSLLVADSVGIVSLVGLWPLTGLWAFPIAEAAATVSALVVIVHYTGRTYRVLGLPRLWELLRAAGGMPPFTQLRSALPPALAYALVGAESLIVLAVLTVPGGTGRSSLLVLVAALGPVVRAGFEWAQLLYFDLVRLGLPLLRDLRRRFDASVLVLAVVVGVATSLTAMTIGAGVLGVRDPMLIVLLLPLFLSRSLLASVQMRAFTDGAYLRLALVGGLASLGALAALAATTSEAGRLAVLSLVLAAAFVALLVSSRTTSDAEHPLLTVPEWLAQLQRVGHAITVTQLRFDTRSLARGVTAEARQTEEWRRQQVAGRIAARVNGAGGAVTWIGPHHLVWFGPMIDLSRIVRLGGGLIADRPASSRFETGADAARAVCGTLGLAGARREPDTDLLLAEFERLFPAGIVYRTGRPPPKALAAIGSRVRSELLRAALSYAGDLSEVRRARWDVSALVAEGALEAIFLVDHRGRGAARRRWARFIRTQNLLRAALGRHASGAKAAE